MSHMIDSLAWTGETPWHGLGRKIPTHVTVDEMIRFGGLDWQVVPRPIFAQLPLGYVECQGVKALTRSDRGTVLSVVSNSYGIVQNAEALSLAAAAVGPEKACAEVCGALDEGRRIFVVLKLDTPIDVDGDKVLPYILVSTGHTGDTAVNFRFTPVRVVCNNTLTLAMSENTPHSLSIRHTSKAADRVKQAADCITAARTYFGVFNTTALALVNKHFNHFEKGRDFAEYLFPTRKADGRTVVPFNQEKLRIMLRQQRGFATERRYAYTAWGAFNAVTALLDHNLRGRNNKSVRMHRALDGNGQDIRDKAVDWLLAA